MGTPMEHDDDADAALGKPSFKNGILWDKILKFGMCVLQFYTISYFFLCTIRLKIIHFLVCESIHLCITSSLHQSCWKLEIRLTPLMIFACSADSSLMTLWWLCDDSVMIIHLYFYLYLNLQKFFFSQNICLIQLHCS